MRDQPGAINPVSFAVARGILTIVFNGYLRTHVAGRENVPPEGVPTIIAANHSSALDLFAAGYALQRPGHFIAKAELLAIPVFGQFLHSVGAIPARRDHTDADVLRQLLAALDSGGLTGLAPEGTRSLDGRLGRYDPGFAWLAARTGACVVPCAIHGAQRLMPKGARWPRPGHIWLRFGEPSSFDGIVAHPPREQLVAFADGVRDRTAAMLADLAAESGIPLPQAGEARRDA